ncbi:Ig-like domain-containing protein [Ruminiclostridium cellobioparum]|uniref:Ig domain-containing protein n=1 Tax=Ruminiclostridium cellobioparum subsp. termitidis CT1112 TaxID=1195236 RepID=S0FN99_RUMCE|nr:Ig-like domain-containing protein [Ruminiclostridium cellobioparum]EMS69958.1 Ig domain-containing protein [Ruminiclostridium cellobioparum subsp. termitidis CT1112]
MKRFNKLLCFMVVFVAVMAALCTVSFAATIGQPLLSPEAGWQRIDDSNRLIKFEGTNWLEITNSNWHESTVHYINSGTEANYITFSFKGTKLRIIDNIYQIGHSEKIEITIDGQTEYYSEHHNNAYTTIRGIVYEKLELENKIHKVKIKVSADAKEKYMCFDAIDIDDTGYLVDINNPVAPTSLVATGGNLNVDLFWDAVEGATNYMVKRSITPGDSYEIIATTSAITYNDTNVINGTTYYYVVSAVNAGGESPNSNEASATPTAPQPTNQLKLVLEVNQQKQLSVSEELSDNTEMDWVSSEPSIATVDANGNLKALKPGNTVITCTSKDKAYTESINVLVVDLEYQLAVDLNIGGTCRLTIDDLKNTTFVTWTSYDPTIATVSAKGKVTAVSEGLTYITATDKDGKEIGRIYIRVRQ